ncbi:uncharacterized protein LOC120260005 [Dioscorea cayenensis subsp. rotundata]|uniref:Uncharacterized protein LOC120260005 n=1 Tax=Dioscorea cayennensis subsp. rotundata TaxID=55577 RepID=A0AB40B8K1_DIOCR|nr:uncharacterized protein LOC120260005 [Dioscorea cayenensis subsp. rotundata]
MVNRVTCPWRSNTRLIGPIKAMNFDLRKAGEQRMLHLNELDEWRMNAYENDRICKERIRKWHHKHIKTPKDVNMGDQVLLFNSRLRLFLGKLKSRWFGPYTVTEVSPHGAIEISHLERGTFKVNGHRLKPYFGGEVSKDIKEIFFLREPP